MQQFLFTLDADIPHPPHPPTLPHPPTHTHTRLHPTTPTHSHPHPPTPNHTHPLTPTPTHTQPHPPTLKPPHSPASFSCSFPPWQQCSWWSPQQQQSPPPWAQQHSTYETTRQDKWTFIDSWLLSTPSSSHPSPPQPPTSPSLLPPPHLLNLLPPIPSSLVSPLTFGSLPAAPCFCTQSSASSTNNFSFSRFLRI